MRYTLCDFAGILNILEESRGFIKVVSTVKIFYFLQGDFDDGVFAVHFMNHTAKRHRISPFPYFPDLKPCDFFTVLTLERCTNNSHKLQLTLNITLIVCQPVSIKTLSAKSANFVLGLGHIIAVKGSYIENIVIKFFKRRSHLEARLEIFFS